MNPVEKLWAAWRREHKAIDQITDGHDAGTKGLVISRIGFVTPADVQPGDVVLDKPEAIEYMRSWFETAARDSKFYDDVEAWGPTAERTVLIRRKIEP
jgi:hypothetical protein